MNNKQRTAAIEMATKGHTIDDIVEKFGCCRATARRIQRLADGTDSKLQEFVYDVGFYAKERIARLYAQGADLRALAHDYECSTFIMEQYIRLMAIKGPSKVRIPVPRRNGRR